MASSLQEQLLKAGLVTQQKAKQTKTDKRKDAKARGQAPDPAAEERRRRAEPRPRPRRPSATAPSIASARRRPDGPPWPTSCASSSMPTGSPATAASWPSTSPTARPSSASTSPPEQQRGLSDGRLAVVRQDHFYELVPGEIADKVRERDPSLVVVHNQRQPEAGGQPGPTPRTPMPGTRFLTT